MFTFRNVALLFVMCVCVVMEMKYTVLASVLQFSLKQRMKELKRKKQEYTIIVHYFHVDQRMLNSFFNPALVFEQ